MSRTPLWTALLGVSVLTPALQAGFQPFGVNAIYFGDQFIPARGTGIFSPQPFYQTPFGNNFPPSPDQIIELPETEFDSYVAFGGAPSNESSLGIAPPNTPMGFDDATGFFEPTNQGVGGAVFAGTNPGQSRLNSFFNREAFFFARLTVPTDVTPGGSIAFDIQGQEGTLFETIELIGASGPGPVSRGFREFRVFGQKTETNKELPLFAANRGDQQTGFFDVYDFYIVQVPTPGALSLVGVGALALRRRRR